jgi:hypothetical protein
MDTGAIVSKNIGMPQPCPNEKPPNDGVLSDSDDGEDCEEAWEWRRLYLSPDATVWDLLCCPEDVVCTAECRHANTAIIQEDHIVFKNCLVPVCDECYQYMCQEPLYASPMALANDNVIGYT